MTVMRIYRSLALGALGLLALAGCGASSTEQAAPAPSKTEYQDGQAAKVVSVQSANSLTVDVDGATEQVRMVNVAAPTENNNEMSGACLIQESADYLKKKLPEGTEITLQFDDAQIGSTGALDAAVYLGDALINADVVGAGMATTTYATAKDEFYSEISQAQQGAAEKKVGLYDPSIDCTIPYQIAQAQQKVKSAGELGEEADRERVYKEASALYNQLSKATQAPAQWVGSIVTLDSVSTQLDDLRGALDKNYYDENGMSEADYASATATTGRPG